MRILILATELSPMTGGIQRYTQALALAAAKVAGPANVLVLPFNGTYPIAQSEYMLNDKLARLQRLWGVVPRRWVHAFHVRRLIAEFQPDLIICNHVELAAHGWRAKQQSGTSYWVVAYGIEVWGDIPRGQAAALGKADSVVAISKVTQEILAAKGIPRHKIELLYYGFDTNMFSPKAERASAAPVLLTVCRLDAGERYKGYDAVVELMPDLLKEFPALRYRIVGDGTDRPRVEALARRAALGRKRTAQRSNLSQQPGLLRAQLRHTLICVGDSQQLCGRSGCMRQHCLDACAILALQILQ